MILIAVNTIDIVLLGISAAVFVPLAVGLVLVVRDTRRGSGKWGINTAKLVCPSCGAAAPLVRKPDGLDQALWGGVTCPECSTRYDKWGVAVT